LKVLLRWKNDGDLPPFAATWRRSNAQDHPDDVSLFGRIFRGPRPGLIDEFRILVHPVVLGQGRPLFENPDVRMSLRLKGTRSFGNGVVLLNYSSDPGS
jgi:dihydrofolate reductase